jgi:hypothetical protein
MLATAEGLVPVSATVCVLPFTPLLLSVIVRVPVLVPETFGENVTVIVQIPLGATAAVQVLVSAKAVAFAPLMAMLLTVSGAVPLLVFETVTAWPAAVLPTAVLANVKVAGLTVTTGAVPVPMRETGWVLPV